VRKLILVRFADPSLLAPFGVEGELCQAVLTDVDTMGITVESQLSVKLGDRPRAKPVTICGNLFIPWAHIVAWFEMEQEPDEVPIGLLPVPGISPAPRPTRKATGGQRQEAKKKIEIK